ncbi:protein of unknown function [Aminobacter niigataensis]|nr:protein of unknown function [Aminobacter niigataensis]
MRRAAPKQFPKHQKSHLKQSRSGTFYVAIQSMSLPHKGFCTHRLPINWPLFRRAPDRKFR